MIQIAPNESEVLVTLSDGSTRTYTVKGPKAIAKTKATIDELGPAGPQVVGSPKARKMLAEADEEEPELRYEEDLEGGDEAELFGDDSDIPF